MGHHAFVLLSLAVTLCGCIVEVSNAPFDPPTQCTVPSDCPRSACALPTCDTGLCGVRAELDGMSCDYAANVPGRCESGECVAVLPSSRICNGNAKACVTDGDCFERQCTRSVCLEGTCVHVPYEDGATCIDYDSTIGIFAGACTSCTCSPSITIRAEALPK